MERFDLQTPDRQLMDARRQVRELESLLVAERVGNQERTAQIRDLHQSTSWRLTAPLRWLVEALRRLRQQPETPAVDALPAGDGVADYASCLPAALLRPDLGGLESANATCRRINLHPVLEGLLADEARMALAGTLPETGAAYRGWRPDPPAIGFIGSDELRVELSFDACVAVLDEDNWQDVLKAGAFRFLVVETVWHVGHRNWRYALTGGEASAGFRRLLEHCRRISLPVVVWFREAPGNYQHFAWLAGQADMVCVADAGIAARLRRDFPQATVEYMPPAIQPALHNPVRSYGLMEAADILGNHIVFDGWWDLQGRLPELPRLREIRDQGLLVAESRWDFSNVRLDDSDEFRDCTIGCLDSEEKLAMARLQGAEVFAAEPLAGAWRSALGMARAAASGSLVARLDDAEPWLPELRLPDDAAGTGTVAALRTLMGDPLARGRWRHLAWRGLMSGHTIAHRLQHMADTLRTGGTFLPPDERIAVLLVTMRPERLQGCIERFRNDAYPHKELVVVVHCDDIDLDGYRRLVRDGEPIRILQAGTSRSLGACLNFAASHTDAPYWTKVDDDDLYGAQYLADIMRYQRIGNFDVFGKPPIFNYLESSDELLWDVEWARHANVLHAAADARSALVAGGTLGGRRRVLERVPFCERRRGGSDSEFIRRCYDAGFDVLAMDGFNFIRCRSAQEGFHTWAIDEDEFRARSLRIGDFEDTGQALC